MNTLPNILIDVSFISLAIRSLRRMGEFDVTIKSSPFLVTARVPLLVLLCARNCFAANAHVARFNGISIMKNGQLLWNVWYFFYCRRSLCFMESSWKWRATAEPIRGRLIGLPLLPHKSLLFAAFVNYVKENLIFHDLCAIAVALRRKALLSALSSSSRDFFLDFPNPLSVIQRYFSDLFPYNTRRWQNRWLGTLLSSSISNRSRHPYSLNINCTWYQLCVTTVRVQAQLSKLFEQHISVERNEKSDHDSIASMAPKSFL